MVNMTQLNINLSDKELRVVEMMAPGKTAEEIINMVLKDWFASNLSRMHENIKTQTVVIDEVIADNAQKVDKPVVK